MATVRICIRELACFLILLMAAPPCIYAQPTVDPAMNPVSAQDPAPLFGQEELDQMLAPVALYPDALLVQVLMAATYPLEVIEASRWVTARPDLKGPALAAALEQQHWDPSVKSLTNFPSLLTMMDQRLDWTQKLGDAFLSQKDQVMDTVQKLRAAAAAQGALTSTSQQKVITEGPDIIIEPVDPQVMYVPSYDPTIVYGQWWYPAHPPYSYYPAGTALSGSILSFGTGVVLGAAWGWAWGGFNWRHHIVSMNVYQNTVYNRQINRNVLAGRYGAGWGPWRHDPAHRRGIAYRDYQMAQRYGQAPRGTPAQRSEFRGYPPTPPRWSGPAGPDRGGHSVQILSDRGRQSRGVMSPRTGTAHEHESSDLYHGYDQHNLVEAPAVGRRGNRDEQKPGQLFGPLPVLATSRPVQDEPDQTTQRRYEL